MYLSSRDKTVPTTRSDRRGGLLTVGTALNRLVEIVTLWFRLLLKNQQPFRQRNVLSRLIHVAIDCPVCA